MIYVEVRGFGKLYFVFKERGWPTPLTCQVNDAVTPTELLKELKIPENDVEAVFVNRVISPLDTTLKDGDRVAFVPPGIPTIHRFNLGFYGTNGGKGTAPPTTPGSI